MFDITGDDIARLNDADLRTLVARLAIAELSKQGAPVSAVTAGGNQDAPDGGLDVRVDLAAPPPRPDFVSRAKTGFQVKRPDMPAGKIIDEMRPKDQLRSVIADLIDNKGAYIIVSAQGSVADGPLAARKAAMRQALGDYPNADELAVDFYDRDRIAVWVNEYPGVAAWVRNRIGRELKGWRPIGQWSDARTADDTGYLVNDHAVLIDETTREHRKLPIGQGVDRLRTLLSRPRHCVRLIGLSGLGKTRLAQALFEEDVGSGALDPALSVYTDYANDLEPTAREMANRLVASAQRAILVVDNCNPATHQEIAKICLQPDSQVSLLTIEYDVRDDEPEQTDVFRLAGASAELIEAWLERDFDHVSQLDRRRIAEFSDGNFRVARFLADTVRKGETLASLTDEALFERIFQQRNAPDRQLQSLAEVLALPYSFDGSDLTAGGELAALADLAGVDISVLYGALNDLTERGLLQARGRWRALLPHALSNRLAADALKRIMPTKLDAFSTGASPRLLKSLSRRLGYLHNSPAARALIARWLGAGGPLESLFSVSDFSLVRNLAPVAPAMMLDKLEAALVLPEGASVLDARNSGRSSWIGLFKSLAYEPELFARSARGLAKFMADEAESQNHNSARHGFQELFHIYLSGTQATPEQRRRLVEKLCTSTDPSSQKAGRRALEALLKTGHFSSSSDHDFGARPRDFGWLPKTRGDTWSWYRDAITLLLEVSTHIPDAKAILARHFRGLWAFPACHDALEAASVQFAEGGWLDGWIAARTARQFAKEGMPAEVTARLEVIIERLAPKDLLDRARAFVMTRMPGGYDIADAEAEDEEENNNDKDGGSRIVRAWHRASAIALQLGEAFATDVDLLKDFVFELFSQRQLTRGREFGQGLGRAADLVEMWGILVGAFVDAPADKRDATVLGGFLAEARTRDAAVVDALMAWTMEIEVLRPYAPFLQSQAGLDARGLDRLTQAAANGTVSVHAYRSLISGIVQTAPPAPFAVLLATLGDLDEGPPVAIEILHLAYYAARSDSHPIDPILIESGRKLLSKIDIAALDAHRDHALGDVVAECMAGDSGAGAARDLCSRVVATLNDQYVSRHNIGGLIKALLLAQPEITLDVLLLADLMKNEFVLEFADAERSPFSAIAAETLCAWADRDGVARYQRLGEVLPLFSDRDGGDDNVVSQTFLAVLARAPVKDQFLGNLDARLRPSGWSGSLADLLERRLGILADCGVPEIVDWVDQGASSVRTWIKAERKREAEREESFE